MLGDELIHRFAALNPGQYTDDIARWRQVESTAYEFRELKSWKNQLYPLHFLPV